MQRGYGDVNCVRPTQPGHGGRVTITIVATLVISGLGVALPTPAGASVQAITSSDRATAVVGSGFSFPVTTTGMPVPAIKERRRLPKGLTLADNHNGTANLGGTPGTTTRGAYPRPSGGVYGLTIVATFGTGPTKRILTQTFTLTVDQAPTITSRATKGARVGTSFSFIAKAIGYPKATISESGPLPSGVTLTSSGNGRAALAGTPRHGSARTYPITITASNGVGSPASQHFTLVVRN